MQSVVSVGIIALLGLWLAATIAEALPFGHSALDNIRFLQILSPFIPRWTFFAPNPGIYDYYLLCRYQFEGGTVGVWNDVARLNRPRTMWAALWNPEKRPNKALTDLVATLLLSSTCIGEDTRTVTLTVPYLLLLNYISNLPRPLGSIRTQFLLMSRSATVGSEKILFVSSLHTLP